MTDQEKRQLIKLLNQYQHELLDKKHLYKMNFTYYYPKGTKAQYNHARCIANKLSTEMGKDIRTW